MKNIKNKSGIIIAIIFAFSLWTQCSYGQTIAQYADIVGMSTFSSSAFGNGALTGNAASGGANTGLGYQSLFSNINGNNCTAIGSQALYNNEPGNDNTATGRFALNSNDYGEENTAVGNNALFSNTSGRENSAAGYLAGFTNNTGIDNTAFGRGADFTNSNDNNQTAIGYNAITNKSDMIRMGNTSIATYECQVALTVTSDGKLKYDVSESDVKGLEFICDLRPVVYNFNNQKQTEFIQAQMPKIAQFNERSDDFIRFNKVRRSGFIAQEVEVAATKNQFNFDGLKKPKSAKDYYGLSYGQFVVPLVKAVQEQQKLIELCKSQLDNLERNKIDVTEDFNVSKYSNPNSRIKIERLENSKEFHILVPAEEIVARSFAVIYDGIGKQVKTISLRPKDTSFLVDYSDLQAGKYILTVNSNGFVQATCAFENVDNAKTK